MHVINPFWCLFSSLFSRVARYALSKKTKNLLKNNHLKLALLIYPHFPRPITTNIIYSSFSYEETKEIYLAHISRDCNKKELAYNTLIKTFNTYNFDYSKLIIKTLDMEEILKGGNLDEKSFISV